MIRVALVGALLGGCQPTIVELGRVDAGIDGSIPIDAVPVCRCRITPCRVPTDCTLTGGVCGADFYCVGDFGPCTTDLGCQARETDSVCTRGTASTTRCE